MLLILFLFYNTQQLPTPAVAFRVNLTLKKYIKKNENITVAAVGGRDGIFFLNTNVKDFESSQ